MTAVSGYLTVIMMAEPKAPVLWAWEPNKHRPFQWDSNDDFYNDYYIQNDMSKFDDVVEINNRFVSLRLNGFDSKLISGESQ